MPRIAFSGPASDVAATHVHMSAGLSASSQQSSNSPFTVPRATSSLPKPQSHLSRFLVLPLYCSLPHVHKSRIRPLGAP